MKYDKVNVHVGASHHYVSEHVCACVSQTMCKCASQCVHVRVYKSSQNRVSGKSKKQDVFLDLPRAMVIVKNNNTI